MKWSVVMNKKLIIVESPSKAKTIASYVGDDIIVLSSKGHVRELATSGPGGLGIDFENEFAPVYKIITKQKKLVKELIAKSKDREVLIATDLDREGEAIGWHLAQILKLDPKATNRIVFMEITKPTIQEALNNPRTLDQNLVFSQETRRLLDRIIGFKLSALLRNKIKSKSAGRVQSVALKLIVDLEKEIEAFIPETYYEIDASFDKIKANYIIPSKKRLTKKEADLIVEQSINPFVVTDVIVKESVRKAKPAFITSTLQQDASANLSMPAVRAMMVAQSLYEGKEIDGKLIGLITYMRTDSNRLAQTFISEANQFIEDEFGKQYLGKYQVKTKANAQDAHEAIRPTSLKHTPASLEGYLSPDELKLYKRIYNRAVASLMAPAIFDRTKVKLSANSHLYQVEGIVERFPGHLKMFFETKTKDKILPQLKVDQELNANEIVAIKKVTKPKARFSEATIIKEMESLGIGRPSTYAQTIQTLKKRDYVKVTEKRFIPTEQGRLTSDQLGLFFNKIINIEYTSKMEKTLDEIAEGSLSGLNIVSEFYNEFIPMLEVAQKEMKKIEPKMTDEICPKCGEPLVIRKSRYGEFTACSGFPACKYIKENEEK